MAHLVKLCGRPPWPVEEGRMNEVIPGRGARFIHSFIHRSVGQPSWGGGELVKTRNRRNILASCPTRGDEFLSSVCEHHSRLLDAFAPRCLDLAKMYGTPRGEGLMGLTMLKPWFSG